MARKGSRRSMRKSRKSRRKISRRTSRRYRRAQRGGQAPVAEANTAMNSAKALSMAQGQEYASLHSNQHGGAAVSLAAAAPVGDTGMLDESLRAAARIGPIDSSIAQIQGMSDQTGGARHRRSRRVGFASASIRNLYRRLQKMSKKFRMSRRKGMRGGAVGPMADYASPGMLLSPAQEAKALMGMNPEWKLAADPASFAPKLA